MNKVNGVTELQNTALVYAITHLEGYKRGKSSMQQYYFPIKSLSEAINNEDLYNEIEEEDTLTF
ncbi:MAG: hypothetical protein ACLRFE_03400 [Clostridia bacterium]